MNIEECKKILCLRGIEDIKTINEIRRKLAKIYHPDKTQKQNDRITLINIAYDTIISIIRNNGWTQPKLVPKKIIETYLIVNLRDVYYNNKHNIIISRINNCDNCNGTGITTICTLCEGEGVIKGDVYKTLYNTDICKSCNGLGGLPCNVCEGTGKTIEIYSKEILISENNYEIGYIKIKEEGDQIDDKKRGDIVVLLQKEKSDIKIKNKEYIVKDIITPTELMLKKEREINIFDDKVKYKIDKKYFTRIKIKDKTIKIIYQIGLPKLSKETKQYYQKIYEIEKPLTYIRKNLLLLGIE